VLGGSDGNCELVGISVTGRIVHFLTLEAEASGVIARYKVGGNGSSSGSSVLRVIELVIH
jgi:hypothetical protein